MPELSLNILDIAQNAITAHANLIKINILYNTKSDRLLIQIEDDGCGMTPDQQKKVIDPFYTTRTTRNVGLGIPFFKMSAELTGGTLVIDSSPQKGTLIEAGFGLSHIDRMPLGNIAATMVSLIGANPDLNFVLFVDYDQKSFAADTRLFRDTLGEIPLSAPQVLEFIENFINENLQSIAKVDIL